MTNFIHTFGLQMFADAGTLTNTSVQYVNSYTGATTAFDQNGPNTLAPEMKEFYDTELLENYRVERRYAQFGMKQRLPRRHGKQVEWRKFNTFAKAEKLVEGVIPTGQKMGVTHLHGSIDQYGTYTSVSDLLELHAIDDVILQATVEMGASAAETEETLIRDALLVNTNVLYAENINGSTVTQPTAPAQMGASNTNGWALLTPDTVAKAVTIMKKNRAPQINGKYVAVIHPSVAYDLRKSTDWISYHQYDATTQIFNGEIGELHGVRFIEDTFAPILGGDLYENADGGVTYATYLFGKDAFGIIDPEGGNLEMIVHDKSDGTGGPLNQFGTVGYKFEHNGATILYPERMLRIMSTSSYSGTDEATYSADE